MAGDAEVTAPVPQGFAHAHLCTVQSAAGVAWQEAQATRHTELLE